MVICAGQEPVRELEDGLRRNGIDPHIIGGAARGGGARRQARDQAGHRTRRPPLTPLTSQFTELLSSKSRIEPLQPVISTTSSSFRCGIPSPNPARRGGEYANSNRSRTISFVTDRGLAVSAAHGRQRLGPSRRPGAHLRLLRDGHPRLPHLYGVHADARQGGHRDGDVLFTGADITARPGALSGPGPARVRIGGRARRLSGARLHRRLSAPRHRRRRRTVPGAGPRRPASRGGPGFRTNRYDRPPGLWSSPTSRPRPSTASRALRRTSSARDRTTTACCQPDHRPGRHPRPDRLLRVDGVGGGRRAARPQLQLHQQLAGRAARGQRADRTWSSGRRCR